MPTIRRTGPALSGSAPGANDTRADGPRSEVEPERESKL